VRLPREAAGAACEPGQRAERATIGGHALTRCRPILSPSSAPCGPDTRATTDQRCEPLAACPSERWPAGVAAGTRFVEVGATGGDGSATRPWGRLADALASRPDIVFAPPTAWTPAVAEIGQIATLRAAAGEADDPATLVPDYIRPSYADEKR
jgi:hypothetical protein